MYCHGKGSLVVLKNSFFCFHFLNMHFMYCDDDDKLMNWRRDLSSCDEDVPVVLMYRPSGSLVCRAQGRWGAVNPNLPGLF